MEDLFRLDETFWQVGENINHIQLMCREQMDEKRRIKKFKRELVLWMLKTTKIKGGKLHYLGKVLLKYKKCLITTQWSY
jgi:hypothetical protein